MKKKLQYKPLKKRRLYEEVAEQIKNNIFNGDIKPGEQLPSERELSTMFNVGRPTIREALRTLSVLGLIESNPGIKGSIVQKMNLTQYLTAMGDQFTWMIQADEKSFEEISEVRKYIELGIAHAIAKTATDKEIHSLDTYITKMGNCTNNVTKYFSIAMDFHLKLAELSKNKIFYMIWKLFHDICLKGYPILIKMYPTQIPKLLKANKMMLDAIKSRDPAKIDNAMKLHADEELTQ